ncbi:RNA polymerase III subunit GL b isoform X1 [Heterodontus francisci]|uniref:RNA polymerase III subunit GL b isoform X1 n=1 Tax=Heterodontus francisci TaxID=7792 RepID=UPI00355C15D1
MMSGRGRGSGPGPMTFSVEVVGIGKGETLPPPTLQPPPLYPSLEFKAVPLQSGEEAEYMLALKQELRGAMRSLPYYVKPAAPKKDIERYSDKYQSSGPTDNTIEWNPDWRRLPRELKIRIRKPPKDSSSSNVFQKSIYATSATIPSSAFTLLHQRTQLWKRRKKHTAQTRRVNRRKRRRKRKMKRSTMKKNLKRRLTTSCRTLITVRSLEATVMRTWMRPFTERRSRTCQPVTDRVAAPRESGTVTPAVPLITFTVRCATLQISINIQRVSQACSVPLWSSELWRLAWSSEKGFRP